MDAAIEKKKLKMSKKFADEEMEIEYCKRMLKSHQEKKEKTKLDELAKRNQQREQEEDEERKRNEHEDEDEDEDGPTEGEMNI